MTESILDPKYWARRIREARHEHEIVFKCDLATWKAIEQKHKKILAKHVLMADTILDCGCGYGRLIEMLPLWFGGEYLGIDISKDLVLMAAMRYPDHVFGICELADIPITCSDNAKFDIAILISIRPMIRRNLGEEYWQKCEAEIRRVARKLLYLEYDVNDEGSLE